MRYDAGSCDVAVVGAGHAGIEAALAAARLGLDTVCFTINMDAIGNMPCNPAIGGTGKEASCATRCARRGDGARGRSGLHPVPDAQPRQRAGRALAARAGRPAEIPGRDEAHARAAAEPRVKQAEVVAVETEGGRVSAVVTANGRCLPLPRRRARDGHVSARAHDRGRCIARFRAGRAGGCRAAGGMLQSAGTAYAPVQDRHAAARECAHGGLFPHGAAAGRRGDRAVFVFHHAPGREQGRVLPDLYQRAHACHHPRANLDRSPIYPA